MAGIAPLPGPALPERVLLPASVPLLSLQFGPPVRSLAARMSPVQSCAPGN